MNAAKPKEPKKISQVEALKTGEWVSLHHSGQKVLAKVAWKAEDSSLFIFVDREGTRLCEVDAVSLGQRFVSGDVSLLGNSTVDSEKTQFSIMKSL